MLKGQFVEYKVLRLGGRPGMSQAKGLGYFKNWF
jgi:hypothetical protein